MAIAHHELGEHRILDRLESGESVTQRTLARELGIALGLTNLLLRKLVHKGWVRIRRGDRQRLLYFVTPAGLAAKAKLGRAYIRESVIYYRETRARVLSQLARLANALPDDDHVPIAFYGAGEIAEIAYVCLQDTRLSLVAVIDPAASKRFFGVPVHRPEELRGTSVGGRPFARLIVTSVDDHERLQRWLMEREVPASAIWWL